MTQAYDTDDQRWAAGRARDRDADGHFLTCVKTTGVYCLPSCPGRPKRENIVYHRDAAAARAAGFRACKRCRPDDARDELRHGSVETVLGPVVVAASDKGLRAVLFGTDALADLQRRFPRAYLKPDPVGLAATLAEVAHLIAHPGRPSGLKLDERGTEMQAEVWKALRAIPAGHTASYGEVARAIGRPQAFRAVAQACGANPLAVLTPCHRVVGSNGSLGGYHWGVERKRALLDREAAA